MSSGGDSVPDVDHLDALPDGIVVADADGIVTAANLRARRQLRVHDPVGRPLETVMTLTDHENHGWYGCTTPYAGLGTRVAVPEQSWLLPDGQEVLVTTRLSRDVPGGPVQQVGVVLRSARGRERIDRDRSELVATVAHELRSPLTGLRGFVTTLLNRWDAFNDDQKKLILETVNHDAERLGRLITELLDVARLDTGRLTLHPLPVETRRAIELVLESSRIGTNREIVLEAPAEVPALQADPDKLAQVLTNLVENAVRHGEGRVTVRVVPAPPFVDIEVEDQGDGIPEEIRGRVFTKFWKHGSRGGSGLGMYIVNGLVGLHRGSLAIADAADGGARVVVRWPAAVDEPPSRSR